MYRRGYKIFNYCDNFHATLYASETKTKHLRVIYEAGIDIEMRYVDINMAAVVKLLKALLVVGIWRKLWSVIFWRLEVVILVKMSDVGEGDAGYVYTGVETVMEANIYH